MLAQKTRCDFHTKEPIAAIAVQSFRHSDFVLRIPDLSPIGAANGSAIQAVVTTHLPPRGRRCSGLAVARSDAAARQFAVRGQPDAGRAGAGGLSLLPQ